MFDAPCVETGPVLMRINGTKCAVDVTMVSPLVCEASCGLGRGEARQVLSQVRRDQSAVRPVGGEVQGVRRLPDYGPSRSLAYRATSAIP